MTRKDMDRIRGDKTYRTPEWLREQMQLRSQQRVLDVADAIAEAELIIRIAWESNQREEC